MKIDPAKGVEIEKAVRAVYERALDDRDLDEIDQELLDVAVNQQVILFVVDSVWKYSGRLTENGEHLVRQSEQTLSSALYLLGLENPYRLRKLN